MTDPHHSQWARSLPPHAAVARAQPEYIYHATDLVAQRIPDDPWYGPGPSPYLYSNGQWYLRQVSAPTAWATTVGSSAVRVCIVSYTL